MHNKLFEMSRDLLCVANSEGYFVDVNPAFTKTLGYSKEELLSRPYMEFVHKKDIKETEDVARIQNLGEEVSNFENTYIHKDGSYRILSWSSSIDLETNLIYATARDITEVKNKQLILTQVDTILNEHSIIAITDKEGVITEVNDRFCDISGYSKEELIGNTHNLLQSGVHSDKFWDSLWTKIKNGQVWSGHITNRNKNGNLYHVYSVISPQFNIAGEIESYMAIRFDITKQISLQESLNKTLSILNETNRIAKIGGWELIVETGELNWTDETFRILEVDKVNGQKPMLPEGLDLFIPEHKPIIETAVQRGIEFGETYNLELQALTAKGRKVWISTNGKPHLKDGKVFKLTGTIQDIDERKISEFKLEQERIKSAQSARLASLGELSAGIAHEINNPLTIILGSVATLKTLTNEEEKFNKRIEMIVKSGNRITSITKKLLAHSRKSQDTELKTLQISKIIESASELVNIKAKKHSTQLTLESDSDNVIATNEVEMEQVFINLMNNSIDAVKNLDERWVKISVTEKDLETEVRIIDSGSGISKEIEEKLFEPFYTSKAIGEGTGLGLSITKGILETYNATISIDHDSPNTCFVILFPVNKKNSTN
jgi:PAS domain S-box-containing protein